ncbi:MAG TPA: PTS sugar transporter subunit IIA [bacterium]|nr:PTS sugar transporter subunit IIA [bacterium]
MIAQFVREVPLGEILDHTHVLDSMTNRSKKAAIEDLVELLWKKKLVPNKSEALERVLEREELATTALGSGVAIPHARLEVGDKPVIAIGRHPSGIDFAASDGEPVHLIALVLWAPENAGLFNRLFAGLVGKLASAEFRGRLIDAPGAKEIAKLLSDVRVDMQAGRAAKCEADMLITLQLLESKRRAGSRGLSRQIELARAELPGSMLSRFDRLLDRYGEALVEAPDGVCHGCMSKLSTSFASEMLRNPDTIYVCERCGRYLIHDIT